ncbi:CMGC/CDK/CRK7 protein kinase [Sphaeroforma arctica JP610]|uniref:CMGC/CDK/CRK7 protein kinase n=1 Tax=Sphaeroforma arctica JP610 TaxID=667725 RepID=A0A0L0FRZ2_9EUKA|nr:CMGC/CDK/CRK7 protein kinase [Sphaeroforma arctica JP610]KNC79469.1 CMGC/CDK/CRK7 protein kinase [Sphaeroforma arctica JP610]|eukprot:XP_014153371.1 CMGC/CDK/CRK7 protein kinase [Sphaeroforma arctica JP610]
MFQLLEGLDYCHKMKIMHRDLKASNLLLTPTGHLKIADFGLGKEIKDDKEHLYTNNVVTIWYRPPELLLGQESYGPEIDMWSAGCIFGELLMGKPVFQGKGDQVTMEINQLDVIARVCGTPTSSNWPKCVLLPFFGRLNSNYPRRVKEHFEKLSKSVVDMLDQLLKLDPEERWTAEKALELPYLVELNRKFLREGPPEFGNTLPRDSSHEWEVKDRRRELRKLNATHTQSNASSQHMPGSMGSYTNSASATTNHSNTNNTTHGSINSHNSGSINRTDRLGSPSGLAQESPSLLPLVDSGGRPNSAKRLRGTQSESLSRASARIRDSSAGTKGPVSGAPGVDTARAGSTEPLKCTRTDTEGYGDTRQMGSGGGSSDRVKQVAGRTKGGVDGNMGQDIHARTGKCVQSLTGGTGSKVDPSSVQTRMDAPSLRGRTESVRERRGSRGPFDPRGEKGVSISNSNNKSNSNRHIDNINNTSRDTAAWHDELDSMLDDTTQSNAKDMNSPAIKPVQRNINGQADTARKTVTAPATFSVGVSVGGSERRINGLPMSLSGRLGNLSAKGSAGGPAMDTGTASINRFAGVVKRLGPAGKNITQSIDRMERERQKREKGKGKKKRKKRVRYSSSSSGESFGRSRSRSYSRSRSRSRDRSPRYAHTHRGGPSGSRYRERDRDSLSRERDRDSYGVKQRYRERDISPPMHRRRHRGHSSEGMYGSPNPSLRPYQHEPPIRHPEPYMGTHVLPPGMAARRGFGGEPRYAEERGRSSARESRTKPYGRRKR